VRYQQQAFQEKVFAHVDKDFYMAGEILWFKIYTVDGILNKPMAPTSFAYVELVGNDHRPVLQARIRLKNGMGDGSFLIPASIASGNYWLRAYTSWMKNFSPEFYFHHQVSIVNSINDKVGNVENFPGTDPGLAHSAGPVSPSAYTVQFFPEGGHLVQGLSSRIAFKVAGPDGKGVTSAGMVFDQQSDSITPCYSTRFGMGSFILKPQRGYRYTARIRVGDSVILAAIPAAEEKGYVVLLEEEPDRIRVRIQSSAGMGSLVYLFTQSRHLVKNVQAVNLSNGAAILSIDKKDMGDGVSQLTLFNSDRAPVCERLYFKKPASTMQIDAGGISREYNRRSKVDLLLQTTCFPGPQAHDSRSNAMGSAYPVPGDLSMSVYLLDSLQGPPQENILTYLLLTSDLPGRVESPSYYFDSSGRIADETLDHLLLTQGWTRFRWDDILKNKTPYFEFLPELGGSIVQGKIVDRKTGQPLPSVMAYLSIPGTKFEFSTAVSRKDGKLRFDINDPGGSHELIVQTNSRLDSNCRIDLADPFSDHYAGYQLPGLRFDRFEKTGLADRHISVQVENAYRAKEKHRFLSSSLLDSFAFYGKPDLKYQVEDYTRFVTLEEVMHEYIQDVRLRRQSGDYYFRVRNAPFDNFFDLDPLLLLDGVPVFDANKLVAIDPAKIAQIDIMNRKYYTGPLVNEGIISLRSNEGDLAGYTLDPNAVVIGYEGIQQRREFYVPPYAAGPVPDRLPDNRNQLLWSPGIRTGPDGKKAISFYTSDLPGKYALVVQGLSVNGLPGYTVLTFEVVP
jgi:hypothetical protein